MLKLTNSSSEKTQQQQQEEKNEQKNNKKRYKTKHQHGSTFLHLKIPDINIPSIEWDTVSYLGHI